MTARSIGQMDFHSRDWMEPCFAEIPGLVAHHQGSFVVRGARCGFRDPLPGPGPRRGLLAFL
ncbi:hypothetical protein [Oceanicola sp. S124]|uniref:hypothetical protein n=1 Tax=Oceanicola sp. S124 TaxID=1042378 RepID=UPI000493E3C6|nr:hypothetical protein [Oceanicola sp. S124]